MLCPTWLPLFPAWVLFLLWILAQKQTSTTQWKKDTNQSNSQVLHFFGMSGTFFNKAISVPIHKEFYGTKNFSMKHSQVNLKYRFSFDNVRELAQSALLLISSILQSFLDLSYLNPPAWHSLQLQHYSLDCFPLTALVNSLFFSLSESLPAPCLFPFAWVLLILERVLFWGL